MVLVALSEQLVLVLALRQEAVKPLHLGQGVLQVALSRDRRVLWLGSLLSLLSFLPILTL